MFSEIQGFPEWPRLTFALHVAETLNLQQEKNQNEMDGDLCHLVTNLSLEEQNKVLPSFLLPRDT